jgi:hypothetical protein
MMRVRSRFATLLVALALVAAGCGREAPEPAASAEPPADVDVPAVPADTAVEPMTFSAEHVPASYVIPGFDHSPHTNVGCNNCHGDIPGHAAHRTIRCLECHGGVGAGTGRTFAASECQACHHRADPPRDCARCHAAADRAAPLPVAITFTAAGHSAERTLRFEHARHDTLACTECHMLPDVTPVRTCSTCHDNHHRAGADCTLCHDQPPAPAHDLAAHRGCAGSGCHTDARVLSLPLSRPVCLACHRDRVDHEPGRECAECHLVTDDGGTAAGRREAGWE